MRWLYVIRYRENGNKNNIKAFKTVAKSPKAASQKMRKRGQVLSVRKVKKVL